MGTMDSSAFKSQIRPDGLENVYFNGPGDGPNHGHVVQNPQTGEVIFARDVEGNVYVDKR
jgi:hypothetical protein